ncbi:DUF4293 domain-containing protein [Lutimonas vermicola]|uniref:DUF4293 domain-containing protein n=1 Tax=Lutimonas vermicola TaxID=414288 RepID=A0ABU9KZE6_9FLAO
MLQRIQTVYLLVAIILSGIVSFLLPFWSDQEMEDVYLDSLFQTGEVTLMAVPVLFMMSGLISVITILSFKTRTRQIVFNRLNIVINFLLLGVIVYHLLMLPGETVVSKKGIGVFIPLIVIVFLALANKAIIKDEKLVKSVDRLR